LAHLAEIFPQFVFTRIVFSSNFVLCSLFGLREVEDKKRKRKMKKTNQVKAKTRGLLPLLRIAA